MICTTFLCRVCTMTAASAQSQGVCSPIFTCVQAQKALEEKLEGDAFLQGRVEKVTAGSASEECLLSAQVANASSSPCLLPQESLLVLCSPICRSRLYCELRLEREELCRFVPRES